jgi:hypothetical protein
MNCEAWGAGIEITKDNDRNLGESGHELGTKIKK